MALSVALPDFHVGPETAAQPAAAFTIVIASVTGRLFLPSATSRLKKAALLILPVMSDAAAVQLKTTNSSATEILITRVRVHEYASRFLLHGHPLLLTGPDAIPKPVRVIVTVTD